MCNMSAKTRLQLWHQCSNDLLQSFLQQDLVEPRDIGLQLWLPVSIEKRRSLAVQLHRSLHGTEKVLKGPADKLRVLQWMSPSPLAVPL